MNRIFDVDGVADICDTIGKILAQVKDDMEDMSSAADAAVAAEGSVPGFVGRANISEAASALKRQIADTVGEIDITLKKLKDCKARATEAIPQEDKNYAADTRELMTRMKQMQTVWNGLKEFLADTPLSTDYSTFAANLETTRCKYERVLEDASKALEKLLTNCKGAETISQIFSKDPVNLSTGNFIYEHADLEVGGASPFVFNRFYNALNHRVGALGKDWNHTYEVRIEEEEGGLSLLLEQGKEEHFLKTSTGAYVSLYHSNGEVEETEDGYLYTTKDQTKYHFDKRGRYLLKIRPDGTILTLHYEETETSGRLKKVEKDTGEFFALSYDEAGYLNTLTDHTGRTIKYQITDGLLVSATTPGGGAYRYDYSPAGKLTGVTNPRGIQTVENIFDESHRPLCQHFPDGSAMSYAYNDENRTVELTERNGSKTTYVHDDRYRDICHRDSEGEERYQYNKRNQKTLVVDKLGNKTQYAYDEKGNLTRIINALGVKTELTYESHNRPVSVKVDGKEKLRYTYNEAGDPTAIRDAEGNTYELFYETKGRPKELRQPDGSSLHLTYDERGNITHLTDPSGTPRRFVYDALNRVIESRDGKGNATCYEYDSAGNITRVINAEGRTRTYQYNESGRVTELTDFDGNTLCREYNVLNKPSKLTDKEGRETLLYYDVMWNLARVVEPNGAKTTYLYNDRNRLGKIRKADGSQIRYTYDKVGNRTAVTDEKGNQTFFSYDAIGRLTKVIEPNGAEISYAYDAEGNVTGVTDALGHQVTLSYNGNGKLLKETNAAGESRSYTYTALGKPAAITDEAGRTTHYEYEPGGRIKEILHPDGTREHYTYDENGNVAARTLPTGETCHYRYDSLDRLVEAAGENGERKTFCYDVLGNVTSITDALGHTTRYEYTLSGKLRKVTDASGNETEYTYDPCDRLIEVCRKGDTDQTTRYERDLLGQVTKITDALGNEEHYTYGSKGELLSKLDKEGYLTTYGYTPTGEVNHIRYADGKEVRLSYNALHQLEQIEDWLGITRIENDVLGRVTKVQYPDEKAVSYTYGPAGERKRLTYPDGRTVSYEYDNLLRLTGLQEGETAISYAYNALGKLEEKNFPNGITTRYGYDSQGRLESLVHTDAEGILDQYTYRYDAVGNKTAIEKQRRGLPEESGSYRYTYDALDRLETVTKDGILQRTYGYDPFGNRTSLMENGQNTTCSYNALNQLLTKLDRGQREAYSYDKRGNLTEVLRNGETRQRYRYGALNRLEKAESGTGEAATYQYNGLGYRTGKTIQPSTPDPESTIRYTLDLTRPYYNLLEREEAGTGQTYLWDGNVVGMYRKGEKNREFSAQFYLQDELGSPIRLLGENGHVTESYGYDEFGQDIYGNQGSIQPFGYTGYQYDNISHTYFAQAREYMPQNGRFTAEDVIKGSVAYPQTQNSYVYCWNSPLIYMDYDGLYPATAAEGKEAHILLQAELRLHPNVAAEIEIPDAGVADIIYLNPDGVHEVYEIKPGSHAPGAIYSGLGKEQLERYINGIRALGLPAKEGYSLNSIIRTTTIPSIIHKDKLIKYYIYPSDPGMIYWGYVKNPEYEEEPQTQPVVIPEGERNEDLEAVGKAVAGTALLWLTYQGLKWIIAGATAGPTGGGSLVVAGCLP